MKRKNLPLTNGAGVHKPLSGSKSKRKTDCDLNDRRVSPMNPNPFLFGKVLHLKHRGRG